MNNNNNNNNNNNKSYTFKSGTYTIKETLGQGAYGCVVKAKNNDTKQEVAIKKIKLDVDSEGVPSTALREISILSKYQHVNLVKLIDLHLSDKKILICLEYCELDLRKFIDNHYKKQQLELKTVKTIMYQLLKGSEFMHSRRVLHRDLKPQNILITNDLVVKIADFGLSRIYGIPIREYTKEVLTLWYRSPELIMGCDAYSTGIDMWSIGCILGELFLKKPLFRSDSEVGQYIEITKILGTPTDETLPGFKTFPNFNIDFPYFKEGLTLKAVLNNTNINEDGLDLLTKLLNIDPIKRISAKEALNHKFFDGVWLPESTKY